MKKPVQLTSGCNRTIRLPESMDRALEERRAELAAKFPGHSVSISDIIRNAVAKELELEDDEDE